MSATVKRSASFDVIRLKSTYGKLKITKELQVNMSRLWRDSTKAFVVAVSKRMLHMETGMSKASLIPLARQARAITALTKNFGSHVKERKGAYDIHGVYHSDWVRNKAQGERIGEKAFEYKVPPTKKRMVFHFSYEIAVWQYLLHEKGFSSKEAWESLDAGRAAFKDYYNANFDSYVHKKIAQKKFVEHFQ